MIIYWYIILIILRMEEDQRLEIRASKRINILEDLAEIARKIKH